jgi:hypothetical protein
LYAIQLTTPETGFSGRRFHSACKNIVRQPW